MRYDGNFWINCGNFIFYPGLVFAFGFRNYFKDTSFVIDQLLTVMTRYLNLLLYVFYGIAFFMERNVKAESLGNSENAIAE